VSRRAQTDNRAAAQRSNAHLRRAIEIATPHHPHPNPRVGAVVVSARGAVVVEGAHRSPGEPHAEALALQAAGDAARGGTVFVTLEPCAHQGRTPPCTDALIAAGVAKVVVAVGDPDARVAGRGTARLRSAGIAVETDALVAEGLALDPGYFHHRRTGRPLVTLKLAATLDGQAAASDGTSQWITGDAARTDVHAMRARTDAVIVGAGTLREDDPRLDVRNDGYAGRQPVPVVVAGRAPLPASARVFDRHPLVYRASLHGDEPQGAEVVTIEGPSGVDLDGMVKDLGVRGFLDVLVEGGPTLAAAMIADDLVDRIVMYVAGKVAGGVGRPVIGGTFATLADATDVTLLEAIPLGNDVKVVVRLDGRS